MIFNKRNKRNNLVDEKEQASIAEWLNYEEQEEEGQLAIDVYQIGEKIIIKSTIAGAKPEDLKISIHHDLLSIKGTRSPEEETQNKDYLYHECYWGSFSRSIILPAEVDNKKIKAELENGVLTITLYKNNPSQIKVQDKD